MRARHPLWHSDFYLPRLWYIYSSLVVSSAKAGLWQSASFNHPCIVVLSVAVIYRLFMVGPMNKTISLVLCADHEGSIYTSMVQVQIVRIWPWWGTSGVYVKATYILPFMWLMGVPQGYMLGSYIFYFYVTDEGTSGIYVRTIYILPFMCMMGGTSGIYMLWPYIFYLLCDWWGVP